MAEATEGKLITRQEAADLLGVSIVRVRQLRTVGQVIGGKLYKLRSKRNALTRRVGIPLSDVMALKRARDEAAERWEPFKVG